MSVSWHRRNVIGHGVGGELGIRVSMFLFYFFKWTYMGRENYSIPSVWNPPTDKTRYLKPFCLANILFALPLFLNAFLVPLASDPQQSALACVSLLLWVFPPPLFHKCFASSSGQFDITLLYVEREENTGGSKHIQNGLGGNPEAITLGKREYGRAYSVPWYQSMFPVAHLFNP